MQSLDPVNDFLPTILHCGECQLSPWPPGFIHTSSSNCSANKARSVVLAFADEVSQMYHAPWIDGIRNTTLGGLVLGFGFLWSDLVYYSAGIAAGALIEPTMRRCRETRETNSVG